MQALDRLPWPMGEDILAGVFVAKAFVRVSQLRLARAWAVHHPGGGWKLALSCCSHHGRFVARSALIGIGDPASLARHVVVKGEEHLAAAPGGRILLGFHLGPPAVAEALRSVGHQLTWIGGVNSSRALGREKWLALQEEDRTFAFSGGTEAGGSVLHKARRRLLDGKTVSITADGNDGRLAFQVHFPGATLVVRSGWIALRRLTGAPTLPVLSHQDGRQQVITIHPALPAVVSDPTDDLDRCREVITRLLERFVREHPEQCYTLTFPRRA